MARVFREKRSNGRLKLLLFVVAMIAVVVVIWTYAGDITTSNEEQTIASIKEAVVRATVQCYALEGRYPENLEYLEKNYGITVDKDKYIVHYRSEGENMMPDVRVFTYSF
jgi:hypothetical protein